MQSDEIRRFIGAVRDLTEYDKKGQAFPPLTRPVSLGELDGKERVYVREMNDAEFETWSLINRRKIFKDTYNFIEFKGSPTLKGEL